MIKILKLIMVFSILSMCVYAQDRSLAFRDAIIYNRVFKNIAAYNIRYANFGFNRTLVKAPFHDDADFFYEFFLPDFGSKLDMEIFDIRADYPKSRYQMFRIHLPTGLRFTDEKTGISKKSVGPEIGQSFIIAIDSVTNDIKFLSGKFFLTSLLSDFKVNEDEPDTFIQFLEIRLKAFNIEQIVFTGRKKKNLYFRGYDSQNKEEKIIVLDLKRPEYPDIK